MNDEAAPDPEPVPEADESRFAELPGADADELGRMLRAAAATGLPQVSHASHTVDVAGGELAREIFEILARQTGGGAPPDRC